MRWQGVAAHPARHGPGSGCAARPRVHAPFLERPTAASSGLDGPSAAFAPRPPMSSQLVCCPTCGLSLPRVKCRVCETQRCSAERCQRAPPGRPAPSHVAYVQRWAASRGRSHGASSLQLRALVLLSFAAPSNGAHVTRERVERVVGDPGLGESSTAPVEWAASVSMRAPDLLRPSFVPMPGGPAGRGPSPSGPVPPLRGAAGPRPGRRSASRSRVSCAIECHRTWGRTARSPRVRARARRRAARSTRHGHSGAEQVRDYLRTGRLFRYTRTASFSRPVKRATPGLTGSTRRL